LISFWPDGTCKGEPCKLDSRQIHHSAVELQSSATGRREAIDGWRESRRPVAIATGKRNE